jgi:hypothetical protein
MRTHWRRAASPYSAVILAVVIVVPVASGAAGRTTHRSVVPAKLVGRWSHSAKASTFPSWSMAIKKSGAVAFYQPNDNSVDFTTTFSATAGGRLNVGTVPICPTKAVYSWKVSGKLLTIKVVSDPKCPDRVGLYSGVWQPK